VQFLTLRILEYVTFLRLHGHVYEFVEAREYVPEHSQLKWIQNGGLQQVEGH
jgi:hypothetical protein